MQLNSLPKRLQSIDVFRAVTMFLMIFVNDAASVKHVPEWLDHVAGNEDGLGFADTVFPAFLFIAGLSIPFAIQGRINKGATFSNVLFYIITRALALVVMGFFQVNSEYYNEQLAGFSQPLWIISISVAFFLIWLDYRPSVSKIMRYCLTAAGVIILIAMALLYKGGTPNEPANLQPWWWGILGIIGWAYLVSAVIFSSTKGNLYLLLTGYLVAVLINVTDHMGIINLNLPVIKDGSSVALMMGGTLSTVLYNKFVSGKQQKLLWSSFISIGVLMIVAGIVIRPYAGGISKIHSTPAWVFICSGISMLLFTFFIWLVDVKGKQQWFNILKPAGTSTLTCYLVPYFLYSLYNLVGFRYPDILNYGAGGLVRSMVIALLVVLFTGFLEKKRLRLKV